MGFSSTAIAIAAGVSAAAAVGGAAYSYSSAQGAAADAKAASDAAFANQSEQFNARQEAERTALAQQTAIQTASERRFSAQQADQQTAQLAAADDRAAALKAQNDNQAAISSQRDNAVSKTVDQTSGTALTNAQAIQTQAQQAANAPVTESVATTNPLGAASTGVTKQAIDERLAGAQKYVKNYGDTQAVLSGYNAPITTVNQAATNLGSNLMPAAAMDQLVKSSSPALLAPSSTAYTNAGQYGQAVKTANDVTTSGAMGLSNAQETGAIDLANLTQADNAAMIQSKLNASQNDAAIAAALGTGISTLGNTGLTLAGANGAFSKTKVAAK